MAAVQSPPQPLPSHDPPSTAPTTFQYPTTIDRLPAPPAHTFASMPPFPTDVPTAPLLRLSLSRLLASDPAEISRFNTACEDLGFFYLDLRSTPLGDSLLTSVDHVFPIAGPLFDLPFAEKSKYDFSAQGTYFGYKTIGANVDNGLLDRNEFYNVSKDDIFDMGKRWPAPECVDDNRAQIKDFMTHAHGVVTVVLGLLNTHLQLPEGTLQNMHRLTEGKTGDQLRWIRAPPQPENDRQTALSAHTDFGSVTVLFNRLGGLQILPPGKDAEWCYVKPLEGHAIINLGDAMVKFTNGLLRSNIHRVSPPPGEQGKETRYSLVYFNRPEDEVVLRRLESPVIPKLKEGGVDEKVNSRDWVLRRALARRVALHGEKAYDKAAGEGTEAMSMRADK